MANVQCQYDDDPEEEEECTSSQPSSDHNYGARDEPPAFLVTQVPPSQALRSAAPFVEVLPKFMTIAPAYVPAVNVIHVGERPTQSQVSESNINKRTRRSEVLLLKAAECVSRGQTFQCVSDKFNIPISTIRFFMARKGILPRRRRGRSSHLMSKSSSPEPPFHMQHYKLPQMFAIPDSDDTNT